MFFLPFNFKINDSRKQLLEKFLNLHFSSTIIVSHLQSFGLVNYGLIILPSIKQTIVIVWQQVDSMWTTATKIIFTKPCYGLQPFVSWSLLLPSSISTTLNVICRVSCKYFLKQFLLYFFFVLFYIFHWFHLFVRDFIYKPTGAQVPFLADVVEVRHQLIHANMLMLKE